MNELGKLEEDCIEFIDLTRNNLEEKKNYLPMIHRCEEAERKIRLLIITLVCWKS